MDKQAPMSFISLPLLSASILLTLCGGMSAVAQGQGFSSQTPRRKVVPNIILILGDDLGNDMLSGYESNLLPYTCAGPHGSARLQNWRRISNLSEHNGP